MTARVAINGFGRVGRLCLRSMLERHKDHLSVVALNDLADLKTNAHLFQYDSSYGPFTRKLEIGEGLLTTDGWQISVFNQKDPSKLPWKALDIDIVIESTGVFTDGAHVAVSSGSWRQECDHYRSGEEHRFHSRPRSQSVGL